MRKYVIPILLLITGCTRVDLSVSDVVPFQVTVDDVRGTKFAITLNPLNDNATYAYCVYHSSLDQFKMDGEHMARHYLNVLDEAYRDREAYDATASFADVFLYRGKRTLRITNLQRNQEYKIAVFQVNPNTHELIGSVWSQIIRTKSVKKRELDFTLDLKGDILTITPTDPECTFFWCFDNEARIYDNYLWPYGYLYAVIDMYEQYGFMDNMVSRGTLEYDLSRDRLDDSVNYIFCATGYSQGEINSSPRFWSVSFHSNGPQIYYTEQLEW